MKQSTEQIFVFLNKPFKPAAVLKKNLMMSKMWMLIVSSIFFMSAEAQVDPRKRERQLKDPATTQRAAKADRHVSKDRSIYDTTIIATKEKRKKQAGKKPSRN